MENIQRPTKKIRSDSSGRESRACRKANRESALYLRIEAVSDLFLAATCVLAPLTLSLPFIAIRPLGFGEAHFLLKEILAVAVMTIYVSMMLSPVSVFVGLAATIGFLSTRLDPNAPPTNWLECRWMVAWWTSAVFCFLCLARIAFVILAAYAGSPMLDTAGP